jgi:hypothetical protein
MSCATVVLLLLCLVYVMCYSCVIVVMYGVCHVLQLCYYSHILIARTNFSTSQHFLLFPGRLINMACNLIIRLFQITSAAIYRTGGVDKC